jgi:hypothetical protein
VAPPLGIGQPFFPKGGEVRLYSPEFLGDALNIRKRSRQLCFDLLPAIGFDGGMTKHLNIATPRPEPAKPKEQGLIWVLFALFVACAGSFGFIGVNPDGTPLVRISQSFSDAWQRDYWETRDLMARHHIVLPSS